MFNKNAFFSRRRGFPRQTKKMEPRTRLRQGFGGQVDPDKHPLISAGVGFLAIRAIRG
jgi:hypothetical protein